MSKTEKIKLLIITPSLQCGGSEKFVSLVCNHINTALFSVCLVVVNNAKPFYSISNPAIQIIDLQISRVLFSLPSIKTAVKIFEPDIIFSTANHLNLYLAILRKQFKAGIKFIAREGSIVSINSQRAKMPGLYNWLIKKYYNRFDHIVCQSVYMQEDLVNNYYIPKEKTTVIYNAVQEIQVKTIMREKDTAGQVYKFITVARLSTEKGIERLIHALGLLTVPFQYFIIGEGDQRRQLQQLIDELQLQEKIILTGEKPEPFDGLEDADLLLVGSYYEGFPNVVLEAGAYGIPAIAFDAPGGIAEIITEGENGLLVEDNDLIAFASAINEALAANFNREAIAAVTSKKFSPNLLFTALEKLFLQIAGNK